MVQVAVFVCLGWLISVCLHEFGHAIAAYLGGDTSVKDKGYLTLNPLKYIDPGVTLVFPMIFLALGGIGLPGAAVYINENQLRSRLWRSLVSAAGPLASLVVALGLAGIYKSIAGSLSSEDILSFATLAGNLLLGQWYIPALAFLIFLEVFAVVFNLLPIPSLDGYGIIEPWLPQPWQQQLKPVKRYGMAILFALFWLSPTFSSNFTTWSYNITRILGVDPILVSTGYSLFKSAATPLTIVTLVAFVVLRRLTLEPSKAHYEKGISLKQAGKSDAALVAFERALQLKPDFDEALLSKAEILYQQQRFAEALTAWRTAQKLKPDELFIQLNCGLALWQIDRKKEAMAEFDRVLSFDPNYENAWLYKVEILFELQRYAEALEACDRWLAMDPKLDSEWGKALILKGKALRVMSRLEESLNAYQEASKYRGGLQSTWSEQVEILCQLERYEEALKVCDRTIQNDPRDLLPWLQSAHILYGLQRYEEAISYCQHVLTNDPKNYDLGVCKVSV
jgi:tetratricopeptide (TPR) repeat protein